MKIIENLSFDEERALYESRNVSVINCRFEGPADGESALKESKNIVVKDCFWDLRYPFWHDDNLTISGTELTQNCRAALWYSENINISNSKLHGIKALRECKDVIINNCDIISPEFGWSVSNIQMTDSSAQSEYFMMRSDHLNFTNAVEQSKMKWESLFSKIDNIKIIITIY